MDDAERPADWVLPDSDVHMIVGAMKDAHALADRCRQTILPTYEGDAATFEKRDARYLYFIRASNVGTGLLALIKALRRTVNQDDFFRVEEGCDPTHEKKRVMNNMVGPIMFWGTHMSWWGNYEHCTVAVAEAAGWPIRGRHHLYRLKDIGEAIAPTAGGGPLVEDAEAWRAHWDMSATIRNLVHNGGVYNPTFATETQSYGSVDVEFRPGKIPIVPRELWAVLFRDSVSRWAQIALHPDVSSIRTEITDLHCGAHDP